MPNRINLYAAICKDDSGWRLLENEQGGYLLTADKARELKERYGPTVMVRLCNGIPLSLDEIE